MQKTAGSRVWVFAGGIWLLGMVACGGGGSSSTPAASTPSPTFTTMAPPTATVGTSYSYTPAASETGATVTISATPPLPAGATFLGGVLTWTPTVSEASQVCTFTLQASDGKGGSVNQSWTVTPSPNPNALTGTAASGAPVAGTVTVKDANGHTASATVDTSGHYSLDASNLTAPFILWASGTANGKSASMYSTAASVGTINITPITNLILSTALNATPDAAYAGWTGNQVTTSAIATAKAQVLKNIAPLLTGTGVATETDPTTATFNADGTGLDAALDLLNISYAGGSATVTNKATGSTYTENLTSPATAVGLPNTDASATQNAETDLQAIKTIFANFTNLWATAEPTPQQIQAVIGPMVANGFLQDGYTATQWMTEVLPVNITSTGFTFTPSIQGPITVPGFTRAYSVIIYDDISGNSSPMQMVLNGATWQLFGDQLWLTQGIGSAFASEYIDASGYATFYTGVSMDMDDFTSYAYNKGVRSAIVTGPGLGNGVILAAQYPSTHFNITNTGYNGNTSIITNDATIQTIPDNAVYTVALYSQTAGSVSIENTPLNTFTTKGGKAPLLNAELNAAIFPQLTAPSTHAISYLNIPGKATVSWTAPASSSVYSIGLYYNTTGLYQDVTSGSSSIFDTTSISGTAPLQATLELYLTDNFGRTNCMNWALQ